MLPNSPRFRLASRGAVVRCTWRGMPLALAQQHGMGYTGPGTWPHPARDWRSGRVVFPHTTPDGRLVHLTAVRWRLKSRCPRRSGMTIPHAAPQHASADGWQARYGATVHGTGCRYFPLHVDVQSGTLAGSETFCHAAGQRWRPARITPEIARWRL